MNRPDKLWNKLSVTEREIGGIPNSSEDIKQAHAAAIEMYIDGHVGLNHETGDYGSMYFTETLNDWSKFVNAPDRLTVKGVIYPTPGLRLVARKIFDDLKKNWRCEFDDNGNIGKRYRRQDEIGTPFCLTIDFDTIENKDVTVRFRDTMKQERISIDDLQDFFRSHL